MPYPYNNPYMQPTQMRLNQMEQQFPQFAQGYQNFQGYPQQMSIKGRPVSSYDEAKASMIDLDGSVFIFPDYGNNKIYTKQINLDGTATINTYTLDTPVQSQAAPVKSSNASQNTLDLINNLQSQINTIKGQIDNLQTGRGEKNAESVHANDAGSKHDEKSRSNNK